MESHAEDAGMTGCLVDCSTCSEGKTGVGSLLDGVLHFSRQEYDRTVGFFLLAFHCASVQWVEEEAGFSARYSISNLLRE